MGEGEGYICVAPSQYKLFGTFRRHCIYCSRQTTHIPEACLGQRAWTLSGYKHENKYKQTACNLLCNYQYIIYIQFSFFLIYLILILIFWWWWGGAKSRANKKNTQKNPLLPFKDFFWVFFLVSVFLF